MDDFETTSRFITSIIRDANAGRSFVPFIGSGLSSPSGIIMGMEFTNYLAFTTYLVLCDPGSRQPTHGEGNAAHWNLRSQGWPPLPAKHEVDHARKWISNRFTEICDKLNLRINYSKQKDTIQSLGKSRQRNTALEDFVSSVSQPSIPMILRAGTAWDDEERLRQFKKMLQSRDPKRPLECNPPWMEKQLSYGDSVVEAGIRALGDWRETLSFLAMVRVIGSDSPLFLEDLDPSLIDDFNATITRDKRPSLGHKIISHLSEPLRISTLLTTNFDTLIEDAYRTMSIPLTVLPVSARGDLPNPRTVGACDALIKLHGESHDTRADLSLDDEPSDEDKRTFADYMHRGTGHLLRKKASKRTPPTSRLLVVGYSGADHRCVQMIKHWLERAGDEPRIYWICYSHSDVERVEELFSSSVYHGKVITVLTSRPDLLLYELYQRLVLALPPGGLTYQFSHVLPPARRRPFDRRKKDVKRCCKTTRQMNKVAQVLSNHDAQLLRDAAVQSAKEQIVHVANGGNSLLKPTLLVRASYWQPSYRTDSISPKRKRKKEEKKTTAKLRFRPVVVNSSGGIVRACALAANELASRSYKKVFWVELQDYLDADSLVRDLLRSIALRYGQFQARHVTTHPLPGGLPATYNKKGKKSIQALIDHFQRALEQYRVDPITMVVMLSGRDSYGNGAGLLPSVWPQAKDEFFKLHLLIEVLGHIGVPTLYFPCTEQRAIRKQKLIKSIRLHSGSRGKAKTFGPAKQTKGMESEWPFDPMFPQRTRKRNQTPTVDELAEKLTVFPSIMRSAFSEFYDNSGTSWKLQPRRRLSRTQMSKLEFIYALTLFRHSRHTNAISSEGTYPCPNRFNSQAIDNDFVRAIQVNLWASDLQDNRIFFKKPGGALWMHRDVREAARHVIERTDLRKSKNSKVRGHTSFREMRGRMHFWIGEWYQKAYCSSGHLTPIVEGVYHLISSAIYSQFAAPKRAKANNKTFFDYRCMMFESALVQASKVLLLSWKSIELWQASPTKVAWLSSWHRNQIANSLEDVISEIMKSAPQTGKRPRKKEKRMRNCVREFETIHAALEACVLLEGGRKRRTASSLSTSESVIARLNQQQSRKRTPRSKSIKLAHGVNVIRKSSVDFEDYLESAFHSPQDRQLWKRLNEVTNINTRTSSRKLSAARGRFGREKTEWKSEASVLQFQNTIWTLGEVAYILLRRAKLEFHARRQISQRTWVRSTVCCNLAIDLCKHLPAWNLDYEAQSKIKTHCIYSIGLANLARFFEANRHLNEAQALLSKWKEGDRQGNAIVSIRRAEVKLTECYWIGQFLLDGLDLSQKHLAITGNGQEFFVPDVEIGAVDCWESSRIQALASKATNSNTPLIPPSIFECVRESKPFGVKNWEIGCQEKLRDLFASLLDEAVRSLEIAEKNLGGSAQSSLWWSRLHLLRLRVYGLLGHLGDEAEQCIIFRKHSADHGIFNSYLSASRIAGADDFRLLRAIRYFLEANRWYCEYMSPNKFKNGVPKRKRHLREFLPDSLDIAAEHADRLRSNCNKWRRQDLLRRAIKQCVKEFRLELG